MSEKREKCRLCAAEAAPPTLGEIAEMLRPLRDVGVTHASMMYVVDRVFPDEQGRGI